MKDQAHSRPSQAVLDLFSRISDADSEVRTSAIALLVSSLSESDLAYSLSRLTQGLASPRACARTGFGVALIELLRKFPTAASIIQEHIKTIHTTITTSKIAPEARIAASLVCMCVIRGVNLTAETLVHDTCTTLVHLAEDRGAIELLCVAALVELVERIDHEQLKRTVWPALKAFCRCDWTDCSASRLWLFIIIERKYPDFARAKIPLLSSIDRFDNVAEYVMTSYIALFIDFPPLLLLSYLKRRVYY